MQILTHFKNDYPDFTKYYEYNDNLISYIENNISKIISDSYLNANFTKLPPKILFIYSKSNEQKLFLPNKRYELISTISENNTNWNMLIYKEIKIENYPFISLSRGYFNGSECFINVNLQTLNYIFCKKYRHHIFDDKTKYFDNNLLTYLLFQLYTENNNNQKAIFTIQQKIAKIILTNSKEKILETNSDYGDTRFCMMEIFYHIEKIDSKLYDKLLNTKYYNPRKNDINGNNLQRYINPMSYNIGSDIININNISKYDLYFDTNYNSINYDIKQPNLIFLSLYKIITEVNKYIFIYNTLYKLQSLAIGDNNHT